MMNRATHLLFIALFMLAGCSNSGGEKLAKSSLDAMKELTDAFEKGDKATLDTTLTPGTYVLFCNMAGHFMAGMRTTLVVR